MTALLPRLIAHLQAAGVEVPDDGAGDAPIPHRDMAGSVVIEGIDEDIDAVADSRRLAGEALLAVFIDMPAGRADADDRAVVLATDLSRRLLADHGLPMAELDRAGHHDPIIIDLSLQLVSMYGAGDVPAESEIERRIRDLAHRLALVSADGLVSLETTGAEVAQFDDDSLAADLRLRVVLNAYAGTWRGVRKSVLDALRDLDWRIDDDGWGAAPAPADTFGDFVAGVVVLRAAGAELVKDDDGLFLLLRAQLLTDDPE